MIILETTGDYLLTVLIAAVAGLIGGLAAELLLSRDGMTGAFELPGRAKGLLDLGGFASLVVGMVAGVAILLVLPPNATVISTADDGTSISTLSYDLLRLIATALVAGSAGGSVLTALQSRVTAAINAARVEFVRATGEDEVDRVRDVATRQLDAVARSLSGAQSGSGSPTARSRSIGSSTTTQGSNAEEAIASAAAEIDATADRGRRAVAAAAQTRTPRGE
jgi:hypothetical protein